MSPVGLGTKNHCDGEGKQQFSSQTYITIDAKKQISFREAVNIFH
jgi:hypothetical protein